MHVETKFDTMNSMVKTALGILWLIVLISADRLTFKQQCQTLQCNSSIEICRVKPTCNGDKDDESLVCVYCALKSNSTQLSDTARLLAKSNRSDESSYDEYYEYEDDEEPEYLDDYIEPLELIGDRSQPIRKFGACPKVVEAIGKCDSDVQPDCRFDTDCPGDLKCCEAACGRRICNTPVQTSISLCPTSFECSLNCRLGYRTDSNGCLKCECQSCPSMDQCKKTCSSGYLKDLFGCDICECNDQCPPFSCNLFCPAGIGYMQSENGCPLCQCAFLKSPAIEHTSPCQKDVHCPPGFRCLNDARNVPLCQAVSESGVVCAEDFADTCALQCPKGNYLLDANGCPTCACATTCPLFKCRANCGDAGYVIDEDGCQTCQCLVKVQCPRAMCRMFCQYGFKRDENGCETCACNQSPTPCPVLNCEGSCSNGYRKDYSGCQTCECLEEPQRIETKCLPLTCDLNCKYDFQRDESGCQICACNACPPRQCRMFCMYGFKKNEDDGCEVCECDWTPVAEKIQCDERISCPETQVCNLNLRLCEKVNPDRINWFLYDFEVKNELFKDEKFVQTFKNGLINNIAAKYGLVPSQITVSSVEEHGLTSFQIMPYFTENMDLFEQKMDQIDIDLNSHEFRKLLPAVASAVEEGDGKVPSSFSIKTWCQKFKAFTRSKFMLVIMILTIAIVTLIIGIGFLKMRRQYTKLSIRSDSKTPFADTSYHLATDDNDPYQAVSAPDGTKYVVVATDESQSSNDKRVLV